MKTIVFAAVFCAGAAHFQTTDKVLAACGSSRAALPPEGQVVSASKLSSASA